MPMKFQILITFENTKQLHLTKCFIFLMFQLYYFLDENVFLKVSFYQIKRPIPSS